ncbi:hypothetical protein ACEPAH_1320 [Sanghuangporus vaninii]
MTRPAFPATHPMYLPTRVTSNDRELELRQHVRELLDDYVYTHLTIDSAEYSDGLVSETLAKILKPIPTHGPGEIALPIDPFQTLKARFEFDSLQPYDEVWNPSPNALGFLKEMYMVPKGRPKTRKVWEEDNEFDIDRISHRPMTPLLSRFSRQKTPSLGNASKRNARKLSLAAALSFHGLRQIPNEDLPEENPPKLDDCLDLKLTIDASIHQSMTQLQKKTPFLNRLDPRPLPVYATEYLSNRSPDYQEKFRTTSPPLFARDRRERPAKVERDGSIFRPLKLDPLEVQEIDKDYSTESMKVIDGWVTLPRSDSTPSLSSETSELDELDQDAEFWRPSSSSAEPAVVETLEAMKMEEPLFPRSEYPRSKRSENKKPMQSLAGFITSKLPVESSFRVLTSPKSDDIPSKPEHSSPSMVPVSLSILGQPPSEGEGSVAFPNETSGGSFYRDLLCILKGHCAGNEAKAYQDIIMDERLDEKEIMFMDVPKLPPPNGYLHGTSTKTAGILGRVIYGGNSERPILKLLANIKKVPGVKSLNLELSWRPFSFGSKIPTHTELIGADSLFSTDLTVSDDNLPILESVQKTLTSLPFGVELESNIGDANSDLELDPRILKDVQAGNILILGAWRVGNFDEDPILLSRSDLYGLGPRSAFLDIQQLPDEILASNGSQSNDTSDFSSAITPDFDYQVSHIGHINETNAYRVPLTYASPNRVSASDLNNGYDDSQERADHDACHYTKRRRLTSDELGALCAMEAMSQSVPITINPKDLMLPQSSNIPLTQKFYTVDPATVLSGTQELIPDLSQSQSLSLSLNEFNDSQDNSFFNVADNARTYGTKNSEPSHDQNEALSTDDDSAVFDRLDPLGSQQGVKNASNLDQQDRWCRQDDHNTSRLNMSTLPVDLDHDVCLPLRDSNQEVNQRPEHDNVQTQTRSDSPDIAKRTRGPPFPLALLSDHDKLSSFLMLRGRQDLSNVSTTAPGPAKLPEKDTAPEEKPGGTSGQGFSFQTHHRTPEDLLADTRAFVIPEHWKTPITQHTYLVSLDFVQQRRLVCSLESSCAVRLVERDSITPMSFTADAGLPTPKAHSADISLILGPDSAVVFFPLSSLPSQSAYKVLLDALAAYSWRFSNMLLVLIAFPRSQLIRTTNPTKASNDMPSSYSPPAIKAARRVRRDLALREGTGEKRTACAIEPAFADDTEQAAKLVRAFGDLVLQGSQIDFNAYIGEEEQEGERDLAEVEGMNTFCAAMILQCCTLEEFLGLTPNERSEGLAELIGLERIERVNTILNNRMSEMDVELPSPSLVPPIND